MCHYLFSVGVPVKYTDIKNIVIKQDINQFKFVIEYMTHYNKRYLIRCILDHNKNNGNKFNNYTTSVVKYLAKHEGHLTIQKTIDYYLTN